MSRIAGPFVGALLTGVLVENTSRPRAAALAFLALLLGNLLFRRTPPWAHLLPFMGVMARLLGPFVGAVALLAVLKLGVGLGEMTFAEFLLVIAVTDATSVLADRVASGVTQGRASARVGVIGSSRVSDMMDRELRLAGVDRYRVVGRIDAPRVPAGSGEVPTLGPLEHLGALVTEYDLDLLLMSSEVPRLLVFDEFARSCLDQRVRLSELSTFYENAFGHVPVADINGAWFQYLMQPGARATQSRAGRAIDIVLALALATVALPLLLVLALLIRRDGHPALFRQVRIGERGRPFTILKLRTMHPDATSLWATEGDDRVTRLGRILRKSHLDELPQVLNVLKGDMSVIGPRPEQPAFVERLERLVPYYTRRHMVKPGLTGWAQVRCGYAGSDLGSAWKVAHDLYYLKHRSLTLDFLILGETLRTLLADPQYTARPSSVEFILAPSAAAVDLGEPPNAEVAIAERENAAPKGPPPVPLGG